MIEFKQKKVIPSPINCIYRKEINSGNFHYTVIHYLFTDILLGCTSELSNENLFEIEYQVKKLYEFFKALNTLSGNFFRSLKPVRIKKGIIWKLCKKFRINPKLIWKLLFYSKKAGIGPMAGIAGLYAQYTGYITGKYYPDSEIIIENGGDCYLKIKNPANILIHSPGTKYGNKLVLSIDPAAFPRKNKKTGFLEMGISSSSGTLGHSMNFGFSDIFCTGSCAPINADIKATLYSNRIKNLQSLKNTVIQCSSDKKLLFALGIYQNNCVFTDFDNGIKLTWINNENKEGTDENYGTY